MSSELIIATLTAAALGWIVVSLGIRRAVAGRHAASVEAGARGWFEGCERVRVRGLVQRSVGGYWRRHEPELRSDVVAYRALLGPDLVGWRPWLLVQVTGSSASARTLVSAAWPNPIWKVEPNWVTIWQLRFVSRRGLLGELEPLDFGGRALLISSGAELREADRAALLELAGRVQALVQPSLLMALPSSHSSNSS